ncbi:hypothetical protein ACWE42_02905 [Sutcliffiella cohnii]
MYEKGTEYQISANINGNFNSAEKFTIVRKSGDIVQFTLENGKGRGAMPIEHIQHLLKKNEISIIPSKRSLLNETDEEQQIG